MSKVKPRCYFDIKIGNEPVGRIIFELFSDVCPKTSDNFLKLCTGACGLGLKTGKLLSFENSRFHRIVKGFMIQGGDFTKGDGTGGESIFGGTFADENLKLSHDRAFLLSMANRGPNTNGSQFFITTAPAPYLDGKHVIFGHVVEGTDVVKRIEQLSVDPKSHRPDETVTIAQCGELVAVRKAKKRSRKTEESASSASETSSSSSSESSSSSSEESGEEMDEEKKAKRKLKKQRRKEKQLRRRERRKKKKRAKRQAKKLKKLQKKAKKEEELSDEGIGKRPSAEDLGESMIKPVSAEDIPPDPPSRFLRRNRSPNPENSSVGEPGELKSSHVSDDRSSQRDVHGRLVKGRGRVRYHSSESDAAQDHRPSHRGDEVNGRRQYVSSRRDATDYRSGGYGRNDYFSRERPNAPAASRREEYEESRYRRPVVRGRSPSPSKGSGVPLHDEERQQQEERRLIRRQPTRPAPEEEEPTSRRYVTRRDREAEEEEYSRRPRGREAPEEDYAGRANRRETVDEEKQLASRRREDVSSRYAGRPRGDDRYERSRREPESEEPNARRQRPREVAGEDRYGQTRRNEYEDEMKPRRRDDDYDRPQTREMPREERYGHHEKTENGDGGRKEERRDQPVESKNPPSRWDMGREHDTHYTRPSPERREFREKVSRWNQPSPNREVSPAPAFDAAADPLKGLPATLAIKNFPQEESRPLKDDHTSSVEMDVSSLSEGEEEESGQTGGYAPYSESANASASLTANPASTFTKKTHVLELVDNYVINIHSESEPTVQQSQPITSNPPSAVMQWSRSNKKPAMLPSAMHANQEAHLDSDNEAAAGGEKERSSTTRSSQRQTAAVLNEALQEGRMLHMAETGKLALVMAASRAVTASSAKPTASKEARGRRSSRSRSRSRSSSSRGRTRSSSRGGSRQRRRDRSRSRRKSRSPDPRARRRSGDERRGPPPHLLARWERRRERMQPAWGRRGAPSARRRSSRSYDSSHSEGSRDRRRPGAAGRSPADSRSRRRRSSRSRTRSPSRASSASSSSSSSSHPSTRKRSSNESKDRGSKRRPPSKTNISKEKKKSPTSSTGTADSSRSSSPSEDEPSGNRPVGIQNEITDDDKNQLTANWASRVQHNPSHQPTGRNEPQPVGSTAQPPRGRWDAESSEEDSKETGDKGSPSTLWQEEEVKGSGQSILQRLTLQQQEEAEKRKEFEAQLRAAAEAEALARVKPSGTLSDLKRQQQPQSVQKAEPQPVAEDQKAAVAPREESKAVEKAPRDAGRSPSPSSPVRRRRRSSRSASSGYRRRRLDSREDSRRRPNYNSRGYPPRPAYRNNRMRSRSASSRGSRRHSRRDSSPVQYRRGGGRNRSPSYGRRNYGRGGRGGYVPRRRSRSPTRSSSSSRSGTSSRSGSRSGSGSRSRSSSSSSSSRSRNRSHT